MAQSLRFKRFTNVALLKRFDYPLLREFLSSDPAFVAFLTERGITLTENASSFNFELLAQVLMSPGVDTPEHLLDALYFVDSMGVSEYSEQILGACQQIMVDFQGAEYSPEDLAMKAWLVAPNILQRIHAEQFRTNVEKFESYFANRTETLGLQAPTPERLAALEEDLNQWFDFKKKGRGARVFPFSCGEAVWFLVRHGQRVKREGTVEANQASGSVYYRPEKFDVLVYYKNTGELAIHADTKGERRAYCQNFGKHLFGDVNYFRFDDPTSKYSLEPLIQMGNDALVCSDVPGLKTVALVELHMERNSDQSDLEIRRADDVLRSLGEQGRHLIQETGFLTLVRAKFHIQFAQGKMRTVALEPPNIASFDRESDNVLIQEWLSRRGFIINGVTQETVHVGSDAVLAFA